MEQRVRAAVELRARHDPIPRLRQRRDDAVDRGHAGGESVRRFGAFELCHGPLEGLEGGPAERRRAGDARVGEQDVEPAKGFASGLHHCLDGADVSQIGLDGKHVAAQFGRRRIQLGAIAPGDGDASALRDHESRGGEANAAVAAGDQRGFVFQVHGRFLMRVWRFECRPARAEVV